MLEQFNKFEQMHPEEEGGGFFGKLKNTLGDLSEKLEDTLENVKEQASDLAEKASDFASDKLSDLKQNETFAGIINKGEELLGQAGEKLGDVVDTAKDKVAEAREKLGNKAAENDEEQC